jgi:hypothetical protein
VSGGNGTKFLVRPRKGRIVAGICTGIAGYSGEGEKTSVARGILGKKLNA